MLPTRKKSLKLRGVLKAQTKQSKNERTSGTTLSNGTHLNDKQSSAKKLHVVDTKTQMQSFEKIRPSKDPNKKR